MLKEVKWAIDWTESERGWGQRHYGTTYYETREEAEKAIADHVEAEKKRNPSGKVPDCYVWPGTPYQKIMD